MVRPVSNRPWVPRVSHRRVERVSFSMPYGSPSRAAAIAALRAAGVTGIEYAHSPYVGHYGLSVPKKQGPLTARVLFK